MLQCLSWDGIRIDHIHLFSANLKADGVSVSRNFGLYEHYLFSLWLRATCILVTLTIHFSFVVPSPAFGQPIHEHDMLSMLHSIYGIGVVSMMLLGGALNAMSGGCCYFDFLFYE